MNALMFGHAGAMLLILAGGEQLTSPAAAPAQSLAAGACRASTVTHSTAVGNVSDCSASMRPKRRAIVGKDEFARPEIQMHTAPPFKGW